MFNKILVALDLMDSNEAVFNRALALVKAALPAAEAEAEPKPVLMLLHVLSGDRDGGPTLPISTTWDYYVAVSDRRWSLYQSEWKEYEQRGLEVLQRYARKADNAGVAVEFTQIADSPGRAICELAKTWGAEVVVVGSHGRRGISELLLGSVSNYVTHHAPCSVFVVHLGDEPLAQAAAAYDSSALLEEAVMRR